MPRGLVRAAFTAKSALLQGRIRREFRRMLDADVEEPAVRERRQRAEAMSLARLAWDRTDFYRAHYAAAGIRRQDLDDPEAFESLPPVTKEHLREHRDGFLVSGTTARDTLPSSTGGSTGEPLTVLHDRESPVAAMWWRIHRWWGVHPGDHLAMIQRERRTPRQQALERAQWWPTERLTLDARTMTADGMRAFVDRMERVRPPLLTGYVGGVHELARFVAGRGSPPPPLLAVGVTAAPLTPSQRADIERAFSAPVYDQYRSAEVPWMAGECRAHAGLHVLADLRVLEVVDASARRATGIGDVLVTDLRNRRFPLIRYRMGDRTQHLDGACPCGLTLPRIDAVQGRTSDVLRFASGRMVTGGLTGLFNTAPDAVRQFQIHQHADHSITLRCVPGVRGAADPRLDEALERLRGLVDGEAPVRLELVDEIRHDRGKVRVVLSDLPVSGA
ncbi:phenylacetate-CoA ligase [Diaminobutyricimonas aerilata]|uniref:Phenylacetate-CoA ligase n=1 Tax=Diaminobutyricimonas aerilata TaxID=1162967 RepID=A0A2M9CKM1_9MICO|nr:phenylacetate--CoA ligase family protein [Diaminobutyricimonas aerilata]PJJ72446.1 phenylacetate-CoA ligase [Diaminobutyricimonas aerilata]